MRDVAPSATDSFVEIGPGRGALTLALAASGARIRAIEIDRDLAADLATRVPANVTVVAADFLALTPHEVFAEEMLAEDDGRFAHTAAGGASGAGPSEGHRASAGGPATEHASGPTRIRVVGNLPYNVSSPILFRLLALARETGRLGDATLMLQREVAVRVAAGPGSGDYGPLSILTSLHADVQRRFELPPGAFRPPPKVHSTVIRLRFRPPSVDVGDYAGFERLVRAIFQQRRKTLSNALTAFLHASPPSEVAATLTATEVLGRAGIDGRRRPETLALAELARMNRALATGGS